MGLCAHLVSLLLSLECRTLGECWELEDGTHLGMLMNHPDLGSHTSAPHDVGIVSAQDTPEV